MNLLVNQLLKKEDDVFNPPPDMKRLSAAAFGIPGGLSNYEYSAEYCPDQDLVLD